jgi:cysteine desulfurase
MDKTLYLDNNATTPLLPEVLAAMQPYLAEVYGNPASSHGPGRRARRALEDAREQTAALLSAHPDEVIFTSGATEGNNLALFGSAGDPPAHLLVSPVEHPSVLEPLGELSRAGFTVERLPVDARGVIAVADLLAARRLETQLVAVMLANHETGAIQPVAELAEAAGAAVYFHCDAVQGAGKLGVDFHALGVSSLVISAHKFHGPKGVGALLLRRGVHLRPRVWGGHQQQGRRPGTEPVALAVGLAAALDQACRERMIREQKVRGLRERFLTGLRLQAEPVVLNSPADGLPHTINVSFPPLPGDVLLMNLDLAGVACSTGSACSSGSLLPSPVLQAMGITDDVLRGAMRFSLSALLGDEELDEAVRRTASVVRRLRRTAEPAEEREAPR